MEATTQVVLLACALLLRLHHVREACPNLAVCRVVTAPPGHGKGPVDGEFGLVKRLRSQLASQRWVNTLDAYASGLAEECERLFLERPGRPHPVIVPWDPPPKDQITRAAFCPALLRGEDMGIKRSPCGAAS